MQRAFGLNIPQTLADVCDPASLALVVYDMQVGIVKQITNGAEITARVLEVLQACRGARIRVIFTRHMSLPKELMGAFQLRTAIAWQRVKSAEDVKPWFLRDAPGFQLVPELQPQASEAIVDKITMSAFEGTPLNIALRDCGISAFAIVGIAMEIGIEPTVRQGADLGYIPVLIKDACGFGHREAAERTLFHRGAGLFDAVGDPRPQLRHTPRTGSHSNYWNGEDTPLDHRVERGKYHFVGEVTRQAEQHQRIGRCRTVRHPASALSTITCASCTIRFNWSLPRKLSA